MLSLKYIRENIDIVKESLHLKQSDIDISNLLDLESIRTILENNSYDNNTTVEMRVPVIKSHIPFVYYKYKYLININD